MTKSYKPSLNTDLKFDKEGNVLEYLGNTIVSMMNTDEFPIVNFAEKIQSELQGYSFSKKLYILPKESLHMTIISLLNEFTRESDFWPYYLSNDITMSEADQIILRKVKEIDKPENIEMIVSEINPTRIELEPANNKTKKTLIEYRDNIVKVTDLKRSTHDRYRHHLSISYLFDDLNVEENKELNEVMNRLNEEYIPNNFLIKVPEPEFVIFNDMLAYYTDLKKRI